MNIKLGVNGYGKNAINLSKIIRHQTYQEIRQISVNIQLKGEFESAHTIGDNSNILPTDTQKNTVYILAKEHFNTSIEAFALVLCNHFLVNNRYVTSVKTEITEHTWNRMYFGEEHPHSFISGGNENRFTSVEQFREGEVNITSGIKNLLILKTTDSAFKDFLKDDYTVLKETDDRIMSSDCEVKWIYNSTYIDFDFYFLRIRELLLKTFAFHKSYSVQHTLYAMGEAVLKENDKVQEISLVMPNKHHIPFNLDPFGIANNNEIFMATDEPFGYITGTIVRE